MDLDWEQVRPIGLSDGKGKQEVLLLEDYESAFPFEDAKQRERGRVHPDREMLRREGARTEEKDPWRALPRRWGGFPKSHDLGGMGISGEVDAGQSESAYERD